MSKTKLLLSLLAACVVGCEKETEPPKFAACSVCNVMFGTDAMQTRELRPIYSWNKPDLRWFCKNDVPDCDYIQDAYGGHKYFKNPKPYQVGKDGVPLDRPQAVTNYSLREYIVEYRTQQICRVETPVLVVTNFVTNSPVLRLDWRHFATTNMSILPYSNSHGLKLN
jgi:hypothetical protein